ncbi:MAG: AlpA family phage regulatory protein [Desulfovibrio sp.]|uniref:helix-turn-helix transcriptional regulator n=1 Tax=Desulfovibrio sp. TaxID=885 RepID=UPI002A36A9FC|nr:AlpA family phage regulatory protein [Desulfovibrio sp.]MDY0260043.1 AlpA family phage regulatory protein [Desulfovibrio sp.]
MTTMTTVPTVGFLRLPQILQLVPISKSAWWEGCKTGRFPKPVKLGPRTTAWKAEDIAELVNMLGKQEKTSDKV